MLDANVLDRIVSAPNNNVRRELIEEFENNLLPLLAPKIVDWAEIIRKALLDAAKAARAAPETPYEILCPTPLIQPSVHARQYTS